MTTSQGPPGPTGPTGPQGKPGHVNTQAAWAIVYLFFLSVVLSTLALFWINHETHVAEARFAAYQKMQEEAARRAGAAAEEKLCTTLNRLADLVPPPGPAAANPSRKYEQQLHATLSQLGPDIGCR